jgi:uncharacterized membrane protein
MNDTAPSTEQIVTQWLAQVAAAAGELPPDQRDDLLADLREHIDVARGDLTPQTEAGVRTILERLGDPASIAAEARLGQPPSPGALPPEATTATPPGGRRRTGTWVGVGLLIAAIVLVPLLCVGAAVLGVLSVVTVRTDSGTGVEMEETFDVPPPQPITPTPGP